MVPIVANIEPAINGHHRGFAASHPLSDGPDVEVRFRQKMNDLANLRFRQTVTLSSHAGHLPNPNSSVGPRWVKSMVARWISTRLSTTFHSLLHKERQDTKNNEIHFLTFRSRRSKRELRLGRPELPALTPTTCPRRLR